MILSTARLDKVLEHAWADMTVIVEAGCTVASLQESLAQHGQRLAIDVLWPERATVGGILSSNDSGALRLRYGGLRDLIIGVTLALADGTLAASGGKVVKNVAGYDLPKLATGALGTLGVITRATFRLHPLPQHTRTLSMQAASIDEMQTWMAAIQDSRLAHSALQARMLTRQMDILLEGTKTGIDAQEARIREIVGTAAEGSAEVWNARQDLWSAPGGAIAKFTTLPSEIARLAGSLNAVVEATGIGWVRFEEPALALELRAELERSGGSLVILRQPPGQALEAWGTPGDTLPLMRALKQQFDPKGTLNPGRFVEGI